MNFTNYSSVKTDLIKSLTQMKILYYLLARNLVNHKTVTNNKARIGFKNFCGKIS